MPISRRLYGSISLGFVAAGFLLLAGVVVASLWIANQVRQQTAIIAKNQDISVAANRLGALVERAETGRRGYLITGNVRFADVAQKASTGTEQPMAVLRDNSSRAGDLTFPTVEALVGRRLQNIAQSLAMVREGRREEASGAFLTDQGVEDLTTLRNTLDDLVAAQAGALAASNAAVGAKAKAVVTVTILSAVVLLGLAVASIVLIQRFARDNRSVQAELARLNVDLESVVSERTSDLLAANEEIQRFAYIVSHDLRAPLVNIMGFTSELEAGLAPVQQALDRAREIAAEAITPEADETVRADWPEAIGFIRSATDKMDRLINAILRLSREGRRVLTPQSLNLTEIIAGIADSLRHQTADIGAEIRIGTLPPIVGDRVATEQVFGNLLDNAVKYLAKGRAGVIEVFGRSIEGNAVEISVKDNGRGIGSRDMERIFELFRRSGAQDRPGEGIGLAHVRPLVRRMGGAITCTSELGVGTEFRVVLPKVLRREERGR